MNTEQGAPVTTVTARAPSSPSTSLWLTYPLSRGCNPKERLVVEGYKITMPWLIWLGTHKDRTSPHGRDSKGRPNIHESLEVLGVAEAFLSSGAEPLPDQSCMVVWMEGAFIRDQGNDSVKKKAQAVVQLVRGLSGEEHFPLACTSCRLAMERDGRLEMEVEEVKHVVSRESPVS